MKAKQFIESYGTPTDDNVRFLKAGNTVIVPLAELLEKYAVTVAPTAPKPATKPKKSK